MTISLPLLVLPIPIGWVSTLLLHAWLKTDFWLLSTKDKLIHLLSTTWVTVPVRRMEDRDQRHKGREIFFGLLLAGLNLVGTAVAWAIIDQYESFTALVVVMLPSLSFHLVGCGLLLLYEKTVHPWRQLGKERERHCWGKLQGTTKGIEAEPTFNPMICDDSLPDFTDNDSFDFLKWIPLQHPEGSPHK